MRFIAKAFAFLLVLLLAVSAGAWLHLQGSLPEIDGSVQVKGLSAPVEVLRDKDGVPHLFAKSDPDGWFALGYVHAQDRMWQLEFQRRVAAGRLAEIMGELAYDNDRLMRTLGIARTAQRMADLADAPTRAAFEAYAAGVNAFLAARPVLPIEFHVFQIDPQPWTVADSMSWLLVMAWDLSGNWRTELARLRFMAKIGAERTGELLPPYPGDKATPLPDYTTLYRELDRAAGSLLSLSPPSEEAIGSNNWVVSGPRSATGKPLLANDPHLGLQTPALWYLAHLSTPSGNVVGGTLPGLPFVVLGRNDHLAWSMTTTNSDTQDLFVERVHPKDPRQYLTPSGWTRFEVREEVIKVRGNPLGSMDERRIQVRTTRHGPVLSDVSKPLAGATPSQHVMALAWAALDVGNSASRAGFAMSRARNAREFIDATRDFHAPHQNVVYADREGRIGFVAPALVPVRRADNEAMGRVPVPGWLAKYDWQGFIPFEQLPANADPKEGRIVTANHKIVAPGYKPFLTVDWFSPFRADRIEELLSRERKHSMATFRDIQADVHSRIARELLPSARAAKPTSNEGRSAQARLAGWEGEMAVDSAAALVFSAWYRELTRLVYADELGDLFRESWDQRGAFMMAVMKGEAAYARWCDDVKTEAKETCATLAARAFDLAATELAKRYGEPGGWRWGAAHVAASDHRPFGFVPVVKRLFSITPETPGDSFTVNVGHFFVRDEERPFANRHAASLRAIYDLEDLDRSVFMHSTGQSGNVLSPWYDSFAGRWAQVEYITIPVKREKIAVAHTLTLKP
jgi:penicillin amidase